MEMWFYGDSRMQQTSVILHHHLRGQHALASSSAKFATIPCSSEMVSDGMALYFL